jgi:hypothetical protein
MERLTSTGRPDLLRKERRVFLKQMAGTGALVGAAAIPAWAQENLPPPARDLPTDQAQIAETLARYAISLKYEDLPPEVVRVAKRIIIDSIGCGIGAFSAETSQIANKLAAGVSAVRGATVMCSGVKTSPELAVFANGTMIRYLDFNDGYVSLASGHPSDTIASVLSTAELTGRSGRDLITGTVLAYEVFCRVLDVFDTYAGASAISPPSAMSTSGPTASTCRPVWRTMPSACWSSSVPRQRARRSSSVSSTACARAPNPGGSCSST